MLIFSPLGMIGQMAASIAMFVIRMIIMMVLRVIAALIKQLLQEILEEITGNEDLFDELGLDPFWRRHNWWLQTEVEQMAEDGATEEEMIAFAEEQAEATVSRITKSWIAEPGGSVSGVCRVCRNLDGQAINIRDTFQTSYNFLMAPPAHPNCRCRIQVGFN